MADRLSFVCCNGIANHKYLVSGYIREISLLLINNKKIIIPHCLIDLFDIFMYRTPYLCGWSEWFETKTTRIRFYSLETQKMIEMKRMTEIKQNNKQIIDHNKKYGLDNFNRGIGKHCMILNEELPNGICKHFNLKKWEYPNMILIYGTGENGDEHDTPFQLRIFPKIKPNDTYFMDYHYINLASIPFSEWVEIEGQSCIYVNGQFYFLGGEDDEVYSINLNDTNCLNWKRKGLGWKINEKHDDPLLDKITNDEISAITSNQCFEIFSLQNGKHHKIISLIPPKYGRCLAQSVFNYNYNQLFVGGGEEWDNKNPETKPIHIVEMYDINKSTVWTNLSGKTTYTHSDDYYFWFDSMNCNILFIGATKTEWIDIRQNNKKWNTLSLREGTSYFRHKSDPSMYYTSLFQFQQF